MTVLGFRDQITFPVTDMNEDLCNNALGGGKSQCLRRLAGLTCVINLLTIALLRKLSNLLFDACL